MKINKELLLTCTLAITSNSCGMLTTKSFHIKKLRSFCTKTSSHDHPLIFQKSDLNISTKDNRDLLREIIEQNKENNALLRALLQQNVLYFSILHNCLSKMPTANHYVTLNTLHQKLEKQYNLKINTKE